MRRNADHVELFADRYVRMRWAGALFGVDARKVVVAFTHGDGDRAVALAGDFALAAHGVVDDAVFGAEADERSDHLAAALLRPPREDVLAQPNLNEHVDRGDDTAARSPQTRANHSAPQRAARASLFRGGLRRLWRGWWRRDGGECPQKDERELGAVD